MYKTTFHISGMDCPSEEQIIRLKLDGINGIKQLHFRLESRILEIFHQKNIEKPIMQQLETLNMGAILLETMPYGETLEIQSDSQERKILRIVFGINISFFLIEMLTGIISGSMGLVADSLDMLADGGVYALALIAVGGAVALKKRVAKISGILQVILAIIGFIEVTRRFFRKDIIPDFQTMMVVSILALFANTICIWLLKKSSGNGAHMQASIIFTSNDIIINTGVIVAGGLVWYFNSATPDLIIGSFVFIVVLLGATRILKLAK